MIGTPDKGFTLLEIMIVVAILGIAAAIGIPNWVAGKPYRELKKAARDVYGELQRAKTRAVTTSRAHRVTFDESSRRFQVQEAENCTMVLDESSCAWRNADSIMRVLPNTVTLNGTPFGDRTVVFNPDGTAEQASQYPISARLRCSSGQQYSVNVERNGRIFLRKES